MTEDNRRPDEPQPPDSPSDEHTRPLPPYASREGASSAGDPAATPEDTTRFERPSESAAEKRGGKRFVAAVLVGALVLGGAAGFGGAAAYDAVRGDDAPASNRTASDYEATSTSVIDEGTVEGVAEAVLPSVVKVNVVGASSGGLGGGESASGSGSGIVLSEDGQILTNNHVVEGAADGGAISVSFSDGSTAAAEIVGTDPLVDIAVIQAEDVSGLTPASIGQSGDLVVGQAAVAIGSPFGLDATVTTGIVSALNRPVTVGSQEEQSPFGQPSQTNQSTTYPAIQTDAAINPGNSGGPLVDMSGRVVGINSSIRSTSTSSGQAGSIGLGFSIPMDQVLPIVNQIVAGETPTHARLGISVSDPEASVQEPTTGAVVAEVEPEGAAALAGLEQGDVVTKVDDQLIDGADSLVATIRGHRPGDDVAVTYLRDGEELTADAELGSDAGQPSS